MSHEMRTGHLPARTRAALALALAAAFAAPMVAAAESALADGWNQIGTTWYLASGGERLTGWQEVGGKRYYLETQTGAMAYGWLQLDGAWYYLGGANDGAMKTGWQSVGGAWYYMDSDGRMLTGWQQVDGVTYHLEATGAMSVGWYQEADGSWYYLDPSGAMAASAWRYVNGAWYYLGADGRMLTGWQAIGGKTHYLSPSSGAMATGWLQLDGAWYYLGGANDGSMKTGWQSVNGHWYYLGPDGRMLTGWQDVDGARYHLASSGAMSVGWYQEADGSWYYLDPSGAMAASAWRYVNGAWYWLAADGRMVTGTAVIDGRVSGFTASGAWTGYLFGWVIRDGSWYYLDGGNPHKGWLSVNNRWYYLNDSTGAMASGWQYVNGAWYLLSGPDDGHMLTGWQHVSGTWYYLSSSGAMLTGWCYIGNAWWELSSSGAWTGAEQVNEPILGSPSSDRGTVVSKMVSAFNAEGVAYPSEALTRGGTPTIKDFCSTLYDEAVAEGVRPEVVFCQSMLETGWLQFGNRVSVEQFNFAGIGAVDGSTTEGAWFSSVRDGLRAQVQHLKAYATSSPSLVHATVDPRFDLVRKGSAPYVQWLGIQENPDRAGWASDDDYGIHIVSMMQRFF